MEVKEYLTFEEQLLKVVEFIKEQGHVDSDSLEEYVSFLNDRYVLVNGLDGWDISDMLLESTMQWIGALYPDMMFDAMSSTIHYKDCCEDIKEHHDTNPYHSKEGLELQRLIDLKEGED